MTTDADQRAVRRRTPGILRHSAVRYLIAGGAAFLVDFAMLALFHEVFGWPTWIAAGSAFVLSFVFTYTVQRVFSFESATPQGGALLRYTALVIFNTAATAGIVALVDLTDAGWASGKIVATTVTTVWNYFIYRCWVFAEPKRTDPPRTES